MVISARTGNTHSKSGLLSGSPLSHNNNKGTDQENLTLADGISRCPYVLQHIWNIDYLPYLSAPKRTKDEIRTDFTPFKQSHKSFRTKQKLARAQKQNRPIPQWIRLRTGNTIRYGRFVLSWLWMIRLGVWG